MISRAYAELRAKQEVMVCGCPFASRACDCALLSVYVRVQCVKAFSCEVDHSSRDST
jgi:hypothetical protein